MSFVPSLTDINNTIQADRYQAEVLGQAFSTNATQLQNVIKNIPLNSGSSTASLMNLNSNNNNNSDNYNNNNIVAPINSNEVQPMTLDKFAARMGHETSLIHANNEKVFNGLEHVHNNIQGKIEYTIQLLLGMAAEQQKQMNDLQKQNAALLANFQAILEPNSNNNSNVNRLTRMFTAKKNRNTNNNIEDISNSTNTNNNDNNNNNNSSTETLLLVANTTNNSS